MYNDQQIHCNFIDVLCVIVTNNTSLNKVVHTVTNYGPTFLNVAVYSMPNNILT